MTASLDIDMLDIHGAPTLDLTYPIVDVGELPGRCEDTIVGRAPTRPPANDTVRTALPLCILPDLDSCSADDISDLAANVCNDTDQARDDLWTLAGSQAHIRAICVALGSAEMALTSRDERIERLGQTTAQLSTDLRRTLDQLTIAQGVAAALQRKLDGADFAVATTAAELYAERNKVVELDVLLRSERQRLEREASMHHQTMSRLVAQTAETCRLTREVSRLRDEIEKRGGGK